MAKMDPKALAATAGADLRRALRSTLSQTSADARMVAHHLESYERALSGTVDALQQAQIPADVARLQADLEQFLPAWRAAIVAEARSLAGDDASAALDAALDVAVRVGLAVARAYGLPA